MIKKYIKERNKFNFILQKETNFNFRLKKDGLMFPQEANLYLAPVHYDDYYKKRVGFFDTLVDGVVIKSLKHAAIGMFSDASIKKKL